MKNFQFPDHSQFHDFMIYVHLLLLNGIPFPKYSNLQPIPTKNTMSPKDWKLIHFAAFHPANVSRQCKNKFGQMPAFQWNVIVTKMSVIKTAQIPDLALYWNGGTPKYIFFLNRMLNLKLSILGVYYLHFWFQCLTRTV